jgi:putative hydrolase of the HAD superfamily
LDWGDTVMKDDPASSIPMVEWETVQAVPGTDSVLEYLHSSGRRVILATSAAISDEAQIRAALARVNLDGYFSHIYCFKNTNLPKGEDFYRHILHDLGIDASDALMVGDGFEKDIRIPNTLGMFAVWFNPKTNEVRNEDVHTTVHSMKELQEFFEAMDQNQESIY